MRMGSSWSPRRLASSPWVMHKGAGELGRHLLREVGRMDWGGNLKWMSCILKNKKQQETKTYIIKALSDST